MIPLNRSFVKGLKHGLPIGLGYLSVSFTFGMKAVADGLTPMQAVVISMANLTSAGQFAGLPLMVGGASMMEMALTQLIINLRYALMSLSLSQKLDESMNTLSRMLLPRTKKNITKNALNKRKKNTGKIDSKKNGIVVAPMDSFSTVYHRSRKKSTDHMRNS